MDASSMCTKCSINKQQMVNGYAKRILMQDPNVEIVDSQFVLHVQHIRYSCTMRSKAMNVKFWIWLNFYRYFFALCRRCKAYRVLDRCPMIKSIQSFAKSKIVYTFQVLALFNLAILFRTEIYSCRSGDILLGYGPSTAIWVYKLNILDVFEIH